MKPTGDRDSARPSGPVTLRSLREGERAVVLQGSHQYPRPAGLPQGTQVTCKSFSSGNWTVQTDDDREFTVWMQNLEPAEEEPLSEKERVEIVSSLCRRDDGDLEYALLWRASKHFDLTNEREFTAQCEAWLYDRRPEDGGAV